MPRLSFLEAEVRSDRKRTVILQAARKRFMIEGFAAAGIEGIARTAKVSTATLYNYFPSKTELFEAVVSDAAREFGARFPKPDYRGETGLEQLRAFAIAYGRFMGDPFVRSVFRLVVAERRRFAPIAQHFFERGRIEFGGSLMQIMARLQDEGLARFARPSWAAGQLMGMIEHPVFMVPMVTGDEVLAERALEQICDDAIETFIARFGAPPAPPSGKKTFADPPGGEAVSPES